MGKTKSHVLNKVRELRFFNGELTQQEVADKVGISRQTVVAIEKGNYSPSLELAFRIAYAFDTSIEEIFTYEHIETKKKRK